MTKPRRSNRTPTPAELARNRMAGVASRKDANQADIDAARAELATVKLEQYIREVVDAAPPLTEQQRERLTLLLSPSAQATS